MNSPDPVEISGYSLGASDDTYIIAEIGSNHDGSFDRAKKLISLAAEAGADAAKFQMFNTDTILSQRGFDDLRAGFQEDWSKSVYEVYQDSELPRDWVEDLAAHSEQQDIDFLCTPYDQEAVNILDGYVPAYKIGSGDITWHEFLRNVAAKGKPIILATGASTLKEVAEAVDVIQSAGNDKLILLQCVTNYPSEFESANVRVMSTLRQAFGVPVGYSDHTPGVTVPFGAVSRGGCVIEKHFTDDKTRDGPDHPHSLNTTEFDRMVTQIRQLETALGTPEKRLYEEESTTAIVQRRSLRAASDIEQGETITGDMLVALRPAPEEALKPEYEPKVIGRTASEEIPSGAAITWNNI